MPANVLTIDGTPVPPGSTYLQLAPTLGCHRSRRLGFQLETTGDWDGDVEWNGGILHGLGPRSRRTFRFGEAIPTPYYYPGHGTEDFRDGGLHGMDLCGVLSSPRDWDNVHARCPVFGLIDIATGRPRPLASIALPKAGYSLERIGETSILPEYGPTDETPYNGQHDLRRSRWAAPADEFGRRDQIAVARDMALAWDRKRAAKILKGPKGQGSPEVGREWAFVLIACIDAGDRPMVARLLAIADHVVRSEGWLHLASGGNPVPPPGKWASDAESHYQTVALKKAGRDRMARKLADLCVAPGRKGKYIEHGTGIGAQAPTDGTSWGAMGCGVYSRDEVRAHAVKWKVGPWAHNGAMSPLIADPKVLGVNLKQWDPSGGKSRSVWGCLT